MDSTTLDKQEGKKIDPKTKQGALKDDMQRQSELKIKESISSKAT